METTKAPASKEAGALVSVPRVLEVQRRDDEDEDDGDHADDERTHSAAGASGAAPLIVSTGLL